MMLKYLRDDTNCPLTVLVPFSGKLQSLTCRQISISWDDTQNDGSIVLTIVSCHLRRDFVNILLSGNVNTGDTWQIDNGQVWTVLTVDGQLDWVIHNVFVRASHFVCLLDNSLADFVKVVVFFVFVNLKDGVWLLLTS